MMIGQTLDRYRIEAKLGQGGMGVVYKARDTSLDRVVAIKVLPPELVADAARRQRFVQEARAASALNHPHIVAVYDVRSDAAVDFIVMEYVEGRTLDQVIPAKGLALTPALRYASQIADSLACAHQAGIVHRDLKPSNVIITPDDRVKVLDFGVAKLLDPAGEAPTRTSPITEAGIAVGTVAYMSPEQAESKRVDARSDIFSLGAMLYQMTTGRRPFEGDSQLAILSKVVTADPALPSTLVSGLPHDVERTILRCLRKDPARRFQTMADLKVALDDLVADSTSGMRVQQRDAPARRSSPWVWISVAGSAMAAAAVAWIVARPLPGPSVPLRAVPLTAVPGTKQFPAFSPDGNHVTFTWTGPNQDNRDIYVQQVGAGTPLRLTTAEAADTTPVWSPDGRAIAFLRQTDDPRRQEIRLIPPLGGPERRLTDIRPRGFRRPVTMTWCPDSRCLIVTDEQGGDRPDALFVVSTETAEKRLLTQPPAGVLADTDPAISPDGQWLAFRRDNAPFSGRLQVVALTADLTVRGEPRPVTPVLLTAYGPRWLSNDEIVFFAKGALWRLSTSAGAAPQRLPVGEDGVMLALSQPLPNGARRLAYVRSYRDSNIWRVDSAAPGTPAAPPVIAIASTRLDSLVHLTADGRRLAFISDRSGESEVWAADVSGANAVQLTSLGANPGFPRWAPDGRTVAFHNNAEDRPAGDVYVVGAEGGQVRNLTLHPQTDVFPSFSRDGRWLYFSSTRDGAPFIWKVPAAGGDAVKVSPTHGMLAIESVDGTSLFYVESATTNGPGPLWQLPLGGGSPRKLANDVLANSFDVTASGIYYLDAAGADTRLQFFDFATGQATLIAAPLGSVSPGIAVSPDGRTIFFSRIDLAADDLMLVENLR
jgi:Tol biopolymer transport system component/predicted Ser/Thr protein kinase